MKYVKIGVALLYILSPVDLLPEGLLGMFGFVDDAAVLAYLGMVLFTD